MPIFDTLVANYPTVDRETLYKNLGGQWPTLVDHPNYQNTCAIRISVACNKAGVTIPNAYKEAVTGAGEPIILKVETMGKFVKSVFGDFYWGMSKNPGVPLSPADVPAKRGIIVYHVGWAQATGHFDLWTGTDFVGAGNFADIKDGFDIALWDLFAA